MARTTAILNLKGGVAKTTTAINMAAILARHHGQRVLLIDADSQCNTTDFFEGCKCKYSLADLLRNSEYHMQHDMISVGDMIYCTKYDGIDLLPADDSLMDLDLTKVEQGTIQADILRNLTNVVSGMYDYILIDCPPAFNAAATAALVAADDVIIPIKLDAFSLRGMVNLMRQIRNMRQINPRLQLAGVLPTMWYKTERNRLAECQLIDAGLHVFHHIRATRKVDSMTWAQEPLTVCSPRCAAGRDYRQFVAEYMGGAHNGK